VAPEYPPTPGTFDGQLESCFRRRNQRGIAGKAADENALREVMFDQIKSWQILRPCALKLGLQIYRLFTSPPIAGDNLPFRDVIDIELSLNK
jgi:hypothetical protein